MPAKTNIYLFYGPDTRRSLAKLQEWKAAFVKKHGASSVRDVTPLKEPLKLSAMAGEVSLFNPATLTIVIDPIASKESGSSGLEPDDLLSLVDKGVSESQPIILWQRGSLDKRLTLTKNILAAAKSGKLTAIEFAHLTGDEALKYVASQFLPYGLRLKQDAGEILVSYLSNPQGELDSWRAHNAVAQLGAYSRGKDVVTTEAVQAVVVPSEEVDVFLPLLKSFVQKNKVEFAKNFEDMVRSAGAEQELLGVLGALFEQVKNLLAVSKMRAAGMSLDEIDTALGYKKGRAKYVYMDSRKFSQTELSQFLEAILKIEYDVKQGRTPLAPAVASMIQSL